MPRSGGAPERTRTGGPQGEAWRDPQTPSWDLRALLATLRRRRRWILLTVVVAVVAALVITMLRPRAFEARAEVVVEPDVTATDPETVGRVLFLEQELQTQLRLIESEVVVESVADALSIEDPDGLVEQLSVSLVPDTRVIEIVARDGDPERAAELAQAFADEYVAFRRADARRRLDEAAASLQAQSERLREELASVDDQMAEAQNPTRAAVLRDERDAIAIELADREARLAALQAADPVARSAGSMIIRSARVPTDPSAPQPLRNVSVALVLGLGLGLVLALVVDSLDDAVHDADDVTLASGRDVLARIPTLAASAADALVGSADTRPPESFRDLRTNLQFMGTAGPPRVVVVASADHGEGRSTVATHLATAAAAAGQQVVLVEADLRRPSIGETFGYRQGAGLATVLAGTHDLESVLATIPALGLDLLVAGDVAPRAGEVIDHARMADVIRDLSADHDLVVVDSAPLLVVPDVLEFAAVADTTLIVAERERTTRTQLRETLARLDRAGAHVGGVVLNRGGDVVPPLGRQWPRVPAGLLRR